jgi:hypothetical protein
MRTLLMPAALFVGALAAFPSAAAPAPEEKNEALRKAVDLGPLGEFFKLVSVERSFDPSRGGAITLKLEAKKDVDTAPLFFKVGFFDKEKHLALASPLRFDAAFPLQKGESISASCWDGREPRDWHKIAVRKVEKQVPRGEHHYQ